MATIKQKKALRYITENHGNISKAMIQAGYDLDTAKKPKNLTESKGWQELLEKYLPDELLVTKNLEGLEAMKRSTSLTEPDKVDPDYAVRHKYLETGLKIKKKIDPNYSPQMQFNTINVDVTEDKLLELISRATNSTPSSTGTNTAQE